MRLSRLRERQTPDENSLNCCVSFPDTPLDTSVHRSLISSLVEWSIKHKKGFQCTQAMNKVGGVEWQRERDRYSHTKIHQFLIFQKDSTIECMRQRNLGKGVGGGKEAEEEERNRKYFLSVPDCASPDKVDKTNDWVWDYRQDEARGKQQSVHSWVVGTLFKELWLKTKDIDTSFRSSCVLHS